jgi:ABC-type cobalamin/Fe3+-siderophores transport system ATPase subunit
VGPNGSGKTTTLKVLMGLIRASGGRASILGHDVSETERRARWLDEARVEFWERHGRDIRSVAELHAGPLRVVDRVPPAHPHLQGFEWSIDEKDRKIVSSFYGNRYKLHIQEADRRRQKEWGERTPLDPRPPAGEG